MASVFQETVAEALVQQPWWQRRKDSITAAAGGFLQVVNLGVLTTQEWPVWVNVIAAFLIGVAQIIIHASTKGAVTPSMAERLENIADAAHMDRESVSGVALTGYGDPVVEEPVVEDEYVGNHRLDDRGE